MDEFVKIIGEYSITVCCFSINIVLVAVISGLF